MKCQYCGGEVPSQSVKCPYCNRENPEGIAFQKEVLKKIERNKLLKPFLLKQKTPEMVQKMLFRVNIIAIVANVLLFVVFCVMFSLTYTYGVFEKQKSKEAQEFEEEFWADGNFYYKDFCFEMYEFIDSVEEGHMPDRFCLDGVVKEAYYVMREAEDMEEEYREQVSNTLDTFFRGYIGLSEEEMSFLKPDEKGEYRYMLEDEIQKETVDAIKKCLEGRVN